MNNYTEYMLGSICSRLSSGKCITSNNISEEGEYPVYGGNGLRGYTATKNFTGKCAIIGRQGAYCGNVKYFEGEAYMTEHAVVVVANPEHNTKYLAFVLDGLKLGRLSGQAAQPGLSVKKLAKIRVFMPEKSYQDKIANILTEYDLAIENNNKRIKILEQMAENLYNEWFVRFRFPGHEDVEFENGIPKGWKRIKLREVYDTFSGGTPSREYAEYYSDGDIPWIKTGEMQDCVIVQTDECITNEGLKHSSAKIIAKDSVMMAMYGVNIGKLAYSAIEATCNQACCVFIDKSKVNTKHYLFQYLKSIRDYLLLIGFGAAQQNLSQELIKNIRILMPDKVVIQAFERMIEPIYLETISIIQKNENLIKQRDLLLPRLMSGKLQVK